MNQLAASKLLESTEIPLKSRVTPPIVVGIVGPSNSGKTQLATALIREFKSVSEDLRIAAIKHCPHGHDADREESDTFRLRDAGAACVVASSPGSVTTYSNAEGEIELETLIQRLSMDHDVILVEGYKSSRIPKILLAGDMSSSGVVSNVVATVGSFDQVKLEVPNYAKHEVLRLAEWIATNPALRRKSPAISLRVDGEPVGLKRFPSEALAGMVNGFVRSLSGIPDDYNRIEISVTVANEQP